MDKLRTIILAPYRKGAGPRFKLETWDTGRTDSRGTTTIGYRFTELSHPPVVIFEGADFNGSPLHADDSDETMRSLLTFLTLRPGDTDKEYFADYTEIQRAFCDEHAEALALEVDNRFGEEN
jgi:hypothetical protein